MYDELTPTDIKKMEDEIEYRKLVVRPKALEDVKEARATAISVRILNTMQPKSIRIRMRAASVIWRE